VDPEIRRSLDERQRSAEHQGRTFEEATVKRTLPALIALATLAITPAANAATTTGHYTGHYTGTLPDGASWIADVPATWNGTLLLFSHGFGPLVAQDAPNPAVAGALLAKGYALAGSSYAPGSLWALGSAVQDQLGTAAAVGETIGRPRHTIAFGQSMGGLVSAKVAETGRVDGTLTACGIVAGGADLNDYQLNASYTLSRLLAPGEDIKLTGYASPDEGAAAGARLTRLVTDAQAGPAGRARIALASAFLNQTDWYPGMSKPRPADHTGREAQQYQWLTAGNTLNFVVGARYFIELAAGGDSGRTAGVDYAALLRESANRHQVAALYRAAGLSLRADLANLTAHASIRGDRAALSWMLRTSVPTGRLRAPALDLHTVADQLVPVEHERRYAARVAAAGRAGLLRQAYVDRAGHCAFTTAEYVAAADAVRRRVTTGRWDVSPVRLNAAARRLGLDGSEFVSYHPARLVTEPVS
jgi:hypothetical protein